MSPAEMLAARAHAAEVAAEILRKLAADDFRNGNGNGWQAIAESYAAADRAAAYRAAARISEIR